jgi:predicted alpha-1,2-mannosidase
MAKFLTIILLSYLLSGVIIAQDLSDKEYLTDWVNPLMGTQSKYSFSNGNTYPAIAMPWGMNFWSPQTGKMGDGWMYTYDADKIRGFKQTHQPSPWINDYGQFSIMPVSGKLVLDENERASWFSHKAETSKPYYYSVYLADYNITTEITPAERSAVLRFTFGNSDSSFVIMDAFDKGSYVKVIPEKQQIIGYSTKNSGGVPDNFRNYFVIQFDKPFAAFNLWNSYKIVHGISELKGDHAGAVIAFKTLPGEKVCARVASSFISQEQAYLNLNEIASKSFNDVKSAALNTWEKWMQRITIEGASDDQKRLFYSCLYRTMLFPRKFYEINASGEIVHYSPYNGKVEKGYMFTDNGFWDTFRAVFPLFNLVFPVINQQIQQGLVNTVKESGWLPEWASPGHRDCMIGSNSASIISEAWIKGLRGYDIQTLYDAALKNTHNEGPISSVGRKGAGYYNKLGYIPYNVNINENVARTLEYAYDDFALWQLAKILKRPQSEIEELALRCRNYKNVFDPETGLMRGRNKDGSFCKPFNPFKWGGAFTEGNSLHYTWSVFHDIRGLINLMGGNHNFISMLDTVFALPPVFDDSYYGFTIHEIKEMQVINMGNYAHGNQPIQHMVYLYNYAGEPWKTQYWVRQILNRLYTPAPDGYCGDEDNGQTSAWYVFSALGFYPVCPASDQYVIGAPLFKKAVIHFEDKTLTINAPQNSARNMYVKNISFNGNILNKNYVNHFDLKKGGELFFEMDSVPAKNRGIGTDAYPFSMTDTN